MFDKVIAFLFSTASMLEKLDEKAQEEYQKYANKQVKKAAIIAFCTGVAVGLLTGYFIF